MVKFKRIGIIVAVTLVVVMNIMFVTKKNNKEFKPSNTEIAVYVMVHIQKNNKKL